MKKILVSILAVIMCGMVMVSPVIAKCPDGFIPAAILGDNATTGTDGERCIPGDDGKGTAIKEILKIVVRVMTIGMGILATTGIMITGIQYLTAAGNEEQARKAKRRLLEIVIGVAVYVVIFALLTFLIPDFEVFW